jgi:hypothetical protein
VIDLKEKTEGFRGLRSGISEVTIIDFGVRVKNDRKIAEWVIGLSRNQRSYNPEMGGRNAPKYARILSVFPDLARKIVDGTLLPSKKVEILTV